MKKVGMLSFVVASFLSAATLNFYCGVTMSKAMKDIIKKFQEKHPDVKIRMITGSSGMLLRKLENAKRADLYLPGSDEFINKKSYLFPYKKEIGYNQLKIFVTKGNPKNVKTLRDFIRNDIKVGLGSDRSSVGKTAKEVLIRYGGDEFYKKVRKKAQIFLASKSLISALAGFEPEIDAALNWRAVYYWGNNRKKVDYIDIPERYAPKRKLIIATTIYSKNQDLAKEFVDLSASPWGQKVMKKWGLK